jgi:hypothetical protein
MAEVTFFVALPFVAADDGSRRTDRMLQPDSRRHARGSPVA